MHRLTGGVCTWHAPGRMSALVWLILTPARRVEPLPPPITVQRHCGSVWTTLASSLQQDDDGVVELPEVKSRHGTSPMSASVHSFVDCAAQAGVRMDRSSAAVAAMRADGSRGAWAMVWIEGNEEVSAQRMGLHFRGTVLD